ncbi:MAG: hypothetical protein K0S29_378 [Gammaproteobacteria bacterium]|jgi:hypothetical protein|nr:hypothetical protein [Gammaproteobacteria bacterium]
MSAQQEALELELLKFFKKSLIKYIHIEQHQGFQKQFIQNPAYAPAEIHQALAHLLAEKYLYSKGKLLSLTTKGSDKSCEAL